MSKIFSFFKRHKKISFIFLGIIVITILFVVLKKTVFYNPAALYEIGTAKKYDLTEMVDASGVIKSESQVNLKFQGSGLLTWVGVKEGDHVKKWQAIASLDKKSLQKSLKKEMLDFMSERWDFEQTQDDYKETKERYLVTDEIKRILEKAQFDLDSIIIDYELADLSVKLATIVSPIEGIVTNIDAPIAGINITPATAVFTIADPDNMKCIANIDEVDIGKIRLGQKVNIILDAYPEDIIEGKIDKVSFSSVRTTGGGTAYPVDIILSQNKDLKFRIGMNGDVEIIINDKKDILAVPSEAIKEKNNKTYVQVVENKEIKDIEVETGIETDIRTEIVKGIEENQKVILRKKAKK